MPLYSAYQRSDGDVSNSSSFCSSAVCVCRVNLRERARERESFRTLAWVSRARHVTFVLGNWPPWTPQRTCLDIANCLWNLGWYCDASVSMYAECACALFSHMQRVKVPSRVDLHNVFKEVCFSLPPDVAVEVGIHAAPSRYLWERTSSAVPAGAKEHVEVGECQILEEVVYKFQYHF